MFIASLIGMVRRYLRYRANLVSISQLDERGLRDIGMDRGRLMHSAWTNAGRE